MTSKLWKRIFQPFALAMVALLIIPWTALADNVVADGDGVTPIGNNSVSFGSVCIGETYSKTLLVGIRRNGNYPSPNVYKIDTSVVVTVTGVVGAGLSTSVLDDSITIPDDWDDTDNNVISDDTASITVTLVPATAGDGSGTVDLAATGTSSNGGSLVRTTSASVSWTAINCTPSDTTAPSDVSIVINDDAAWTNDAGGNVSLDLAATDNVGVTKYRLAESQADLESAADVTVDPAEVTFSRVDLPFTLTGSEGTKSVWLRVYDAAGNVTETSDTIGWDKTPPAISCGSPDGQWHATDVSIDCTASDGGSGLADPSDASFSLSTSVPADTETSDAATNSRVVSDNAGNIATAGPISGNMVDKKAPAIICDPAPTGWQDDNVSINCTATDGGSLLKDAADASFTLSTNVDSGQETANASTGSHIVYDNVGNSATAGPITGIMIDRKAPVVSCGVADGIWHSDNVSISCTASDGGSGLADPSDASFSLTTNVADGSEDGNAATNSHQVCDMTGHCTTAGPVIGNKIDRKAPSITITAPGDNATYVLNQSVTADYTCTDGGSGVATCDGPVASGSNIDTASVGSQTFTVSATDNVGNSSAKSVTYSVAYNTCLLFDNSKAVKRGATLPIKLQVCDANGNNVSSSSVIVTATNVVRISGAADGAVLEDSGNANPDYNFRYDSKLGGTGGYIYNLSTKIGYTTGTYQMTFKVLGDPTNHTLEFKVK